MFSNRRTMFLASLTLSGCGRLPEEDARVVTFVMWGIVIAMALAAAAFVVTIIASMVVGIVATVRSRQAHSRAPRDAPLADPLRVAEAAVSRRPLLTRSQVLARFSGGVSILAGLATVGFAVHLLGEEEVSAYSPCCGSVGVVSFVAGVAFIVLSRRRSRDA